MARLREWLLSGYHTCAQCGCLADRRHGSAACGRFLRDTLQSHDDHLRALAARVRALEETVAAASKRLAD